MKSNFIRPLGIAAILLLCAVYSCKTKSSNNRQLNEVFYHELDSAEKIWIDNSRATNKLHDSIEWFNVWHYAHRTDSPYLHKVRLYYPKNNKDANVGQ